MCALTLRSDGQSICPHPRLGYVGERARAWADRNSTFERRTGSDGCCDMHLLMHTEQGLGCNVTTVLQHVL